jgi:hypothetical protein
LHPNKFARIEQNGRCAGTSALLPKDGVIGRRI